MFKVNKKKIKAEYTPRGQNYVRPWTSHVYVPAERPIPDLFLNVSNPRSHDVPYTTVNC